MNCPICGCEDGTVYTEVPEVNEGLYSCPCCGSIPICIKDSEWITPGRLEELYKQAGTRWRELLK